MLARPPAPLLPSAHALRTLALACATPPAPVESVEKLHLPPAPVNTYAELWKFTRPHTIYGTALSVAAISAWAAPTRKLALTSAFTAAAPAILANVYIVGLNQLSDVEIDKINKPQLPLASGRLSMERGRQIVLLTLLGSLVLTATAQSLPLAMVVGGSLALGTVYSLEPFRLKRWPVAAAFCIAGVRGFIINWGLALHAGAMTSVALWGLSIFFSIFGISIALLKDTPDTSGDEANGIETLARRIGVKPTVWIGATLLISNLLVTAASLCAMPTIPRRLAGLAALLAAGSIIRAASVLRDVTAFYMYIWKIFYACYIALPFLR